MELTLLERLEIARLIQEGNTSGVLDSNGIRIVWSLETDKFNN